MLNDTVDYMKFLLCMLRGGILISRVLSAG